MNGDIQSEETAQDMLKRVFIVARLLTGKSDPPIDEPAEPVRLKRKKHKK